MNRSIALGLVIVVLAVAPGTALGAQADAPLPSGPIASSPKELVDAANVAQRFASRLGALSPDQPLEYFLLAEEIADAWVTSGDSSARDLARQLYVLSWLLSERGSSAPAAEPAVPVELPSHISTASLGRSVCLGLCALSGTSAERRWLLAMAGALGEESEPKVVSDPELGESARPPESSARGGSSVLPAALELATALGYVRAGDGRRAERLLDKPEVAALLKRYEKLLSPIGMDGEAERIAAMAQRWGGCSECRNRRVTKSAHGWELCGLCKGHPGPRMSQAEMIHQLRLEAVLLNASQQSWAAQTIIDSGEPLRDLDPAELPAFYRVSADRPLFRSGRWVAGVETTGSEPKIAPP